MAIGPKYTRSAVDIISPMLSSMTDRRNRTAARNAGMLAGLSKGIEAGVNAYNWNKRENLINFVGDDKLAEMENRLVELKGEKSMIENQMKQIQNEDVTYGLSKTTEPFLSSGKQYDPKSVPPFEGLTDDEKIDIFKGGV